MALKKPSVLRATLLATLAATFASLAASIDCSGSSYPKYLKKIILSKYIYIIFKASSASSSSSP
jgi:hypothetical protein